MFQNEVFGYIEEQHLFGRQDRLIVALSGGADSVALLRVLLQGGYRCEAAHCNFHLRGEESERDERFVRQLCERLCVPLHVAHFDTEEYASCHRMSVEMAARELRYRWFEQLREEKGFQAIAVAHHRDDSVETFLLNLVRGAGVNGLKGIRPKNGYVVRPLLERSREEVLAYLARLNQPYVTDSTNLHDDYQRNKIRLNVLPLLRELNPSVNDSIAEAAARLADVALIYNKVMAEGRSRVMSEERCISISALLDEPAPSALLFELLHPLGFRSAQVKDVFRSLTTQSGKRFASAGWDLLRDRDCLLLRPRTSVETACESVPPRLLTEVLPVTPSFSIPKEKTVACLDADKLVQPLTIRLWQAGDSFVPFGMKGRKCVSDYLTDRKYSLFRKERQYVVCSGEDIVWLVDERSDNRYRVTEKTRRVMLLRVAPEGNEEQDVKP